MKDISNKIRYRSSNSTDVDYGFGQLGSAYSNVDQLIVPPMGMVIVAIQFLANNTPTVLTPEKLGNMSVPADGKAGGLGSNFPEIVEDANRTVIGFQPHQNNINGRLMGNLADSGSNITQVTFTGSFTTEDIRVGDYVLLVSDTWHIDGNPNMTPDPQTPAPIYDGPNARGIYVESIDNATQITLASSALADQTGWAGISPSSQSLMILGHRQGAGAVAVNGQIFPKGMTIYGRWTEFKPSAATGAGVQAQGGVICYFGY